MNLMFIILGLALSFGFMGFTFAEESPPPHDPYTDDFDLKMGSEKKILAEESMGSGSGMGFVDDSNFEQSIVIFAIAMIIISVISLRFYLRWKR